jgi:hypothetical protein
MLVTWPLLRARQIGMPMIGFLVSTTAAGFIRYLLAPRPASKRSAADSKRATSS